MSITKQQIVGWIPRGHKAVLSDDDLFMIISNDLSFEITDRGIVSSKNGVEIRDTRTFNPVPPDEVIENYFRERKWLAEVPGKNGNSDQVFDIKNYSQFEERWVKENPGKSMISPEFDDALTVHANKVENFDWHK
ncbi:MAG: hypothetical protein JWR61_5656 [Ferruginibacter sp.]|uniref:hypothetical protein n=1 Tax=Ferruginibacter sp. TaxID=1940288 RepID=UPI002659A5C6|nr:hypothetical protein [Ferruginibacter sp.]MDB5280701.1 hypothetical protein [Ferruginibacter sp.]